MGYPLRRFMPGRLYETTSRTLHGRFLLRPSGELNDLLRGVLARAVRLFGVKVCYFTVVSNHMHLLVVPDSAEQMERFMAFVNGNIAKEVGALHGWREKVWGRRYRAIPVTEERESQEARLRYLLAHGCKESLVKRPSDWPGATGLRALLTGRPVVGRWVDRTSLYRALRRGADVGPRDFTSEESFELSVLPAWAELSHEERRTRVEGMVREIEQETRDRLAAEDRSPLGARRILRQHPHAKPQHSKRSPAPIVHAATAQSWLNFKRSRERFVEWYRIASQQLRRGDVTAVFPAGSIPPRLPSSRVAEFPRPSPT